MAPPAFFARLHDVHIHRVALVNMTNFLPRARAGLTELRDVNELSFTIMPSRETPAAPVSIVCTIVRTGPYTSQGVRLSAMKPAL